MENYSKKLDAMAEGFREKKFYPRLLLHACCAPCSSYCLEYLREYFDVTVFYYNPNITSREEYSKRVGEEKRLIAEYNRQITEYAHPVEFIEGSYEPERFLEMSKGLESCPERGERCERCFRLRLSETARVAAGSAALAGTDSDGAASSSTTDRFDFFTTTLTISPLKDSALLNRIGEEAGARYGVSFLNSDFKKKNGFKRSIELSKKFNLYRQDYCGCCFSKAERDAQRISKEQISKIMI